MRLYSGHSKNFIDLTFNDQIAGYLETEFFNQMGYKPSQSEVMSWTNSLYRIAHLFDQAKFHDHGILLEYQIPNYSNRIDCIICGKDKSSNEQAVIIELKQWSDAKLAKYESEKVVTWVGGGNRETLHPSVQADSYRRYLEGHLTAFYEDNPISLSACSYLHNYYVKGSDDILNERFSSYLNVCPLFSADDKEELTLFLNEKVSNGEGEPILNRIENSKHRPSPTLMKHVSSIVKNKLDGELSIVGGAKRSEDYILLDDQIMAYDKVMSIIKTGLSTRKKHSIIIKGGPGTGKSVIALKLLADLTSLGINTQYATGSNSFTETLRKIVGKESRGFFKYFMSFGDAEPNEIDVLIMDEAHRIREKTGYPFKSTGRLQIQDLMRAAKISVFFVDDMQVVRPKEIGTSKFIFEHSNKIEADIHQYELKSQFRCSGSDAFIQWVNHMLQIQRTPTTEWNDDPNFEFKIFDSPYELEESIREKNSRGFSARLTAGFCWEWTQKPNPDGSLVKDVKIGSYERPWNAHKNASGLARDIPKASFWAYDENGINQVGCIYTAQGFEFDYVGVIFGKDLKYDFENNTWVGYPEFSHDSMIKGADNFLDLVKNTYRVLLTRGRKGCYVYFEDEDTRKFFKSRVKLNTK